MSTPVFDLKDVHGKNVDMKLDLTAYQNAAENKRDLRQEVKYVAAAQGVEWDRSKGDLLD